MSYSQPIFEHMDGILEIKFGGLEHIMPCVVDRSPKLVEEEVKVKRRLKLTGRRA